MASYYVNTNAQANGDHEVHTTPLDTVSRLAGLRETFNRQQKIERNRKRDFANHRKLRRRGWRVVRLWAHQVKNDLLAAILQITAALEMQDAGR